MIRLKDAIVHRKLPFRLRLSVEAGDPRSLAHILLAYYHLLVRVHRILEKDKRMI